jgi:hypothetical protein
MTLAFERAETVHVLSYAAIVNTDTGQRTEDRGQRSVQPGWEDCSQHVKHSLAAEAATDGVFARLQMEVKPQEPNTAPIQAHCVLYGPEHSTAGPNSD